MELFALPEISALKAAIENGADVLLYRAKR